MQTHTDLPDFSRGRVLTVGDVMLDSNWCGDTRRISPEAPVPVVNINQLHYCPGGAANVAMNVASLGCHSILAGFIGKDKTAQQLQEILQAHSIEAHLIEVDNTPTINKLRVISRNQQLIRLDFEDSGFIQSAELLRPLFHELIEQSAVVVFSDYGKGTLADVSYLIDYARKKNRVILVDPKGRDFSLYRGATLITPNRHEFETVMGEIYSEEDFLIKGKECCQRYDLSAVLITRSDEGMTLVTAAGYQFSWPAQTKDVYDVTGAGDTAIAVLASALACETDLPDAIFLANAAASVVVSKVGTATIDKEELRRAAEPERAKSHGVVDKEQLLFLVERARQRGQKIVMTNGCFDILHLGHVTYLAEAKRLGDRLLVAVNTDASVQKLKGKDRPVNHLASRAGVLAAMAAVDWVVSFDEDTPQALIEAVKPDILVKGGDNEVDSIPGADFVRSYGGEVKVLSYVDGFSTTATINKARS